MILARTAPGIFLVLLLGVGLGGTAISVRLAWADHLLARQTREGVQRSLALAPTNALAWERWARWEPEDALSSLQHAVFLNPYLTNARLELGLRAERAGSRREAAGLLLQSFQYDRMFVTRWTLANFYFRAGEEANFWRWARAAAEYAPASYFGLFELCHRWAGDPQVVLHRAIPPRAVIVSEYLKYLLSAGRLDEVSETFARLLAFRRAADLPILLAAVDGCLAAGQISRAVTFWNQLAATGRIPYSLLDPVQGRSLTNGSFTRKPLAQGFDWHANWNPQAFTLGNRIEFSGQQLDRTELLWQPLPLAPHRSYQLRCRYRTANIAPNTGLRWHLLDPRTRQPLAVPSDSLSSAVETEQTWHFEVPESAVLGHLTLVYDRTPGTTRIRGLLELVSVRLTLDPIP